MSDSAVNFVRLIRQWADSGDMTHGYDSIDSIISEGLGGTIDIDAFSAFAERQNSSFDDLCNRVALTIARRFHDSVMTYDDADRVANALSTIMIAQLVKEVDARLPEPAWPIYLAFDAGEYDRGDGSNPVERFTWPLIKEILRDE